MPRTLVAYFSLTENTKKVAEAIFSGIKGEKVLAPIEEAKDLQSFQLIFIGFPVHSHSIPIAVENFLKKIPKGKKIAFFSTHGSLTGSRLSREALECASTVASQAKLLGSFSCRGRVSRKAMDILSQSPEHRAWTEMAASSEGHPNELDLHEAKEFAKWIQTLSVQRSF